MSVRIDKWLWAARFFKTRAKAKDAIDGGKVHLNGARTKPSREVAIYPKEVSCPCPLDWVPMTISTRPSPLTRISARSTGQPVEVST